MAFCGRTGPNCLLESPVRSISGNAVKADLIGKILYDDPAVFRRLRVDQVDNNFVVECASSFDDANANDIFLLKAVAKLALMKDPEALELEETYDKDSDSNTIESSGNHGSTEERRMYDPLVRLFNYIANFGQPTAPRRFQKTNSMLKADEPHTFGFPSSSPDITVSSAEMEASIITKWHYRDFFGEVKPSEKQRPKPAKEGMIPDIVTQSVSYARLFMSARPFMLFCVGIMISGTEFCVGIFDRDGITFSPAYDMFEHIETFIRVVRSLACDLSIEELGSDPSVRVLSDWETQNLTGEHRLYPSAVVSPCGNDTRQWCTIGPPIWVSMSFLGRGTNIWLVRQYMEGDKQQQPFLQGNEMVMKTAWRSSARTPESEIYMSIELPLEGLAKFECGGDVMFSGCPVSVQNLRCHPVYNLLPQVNDVIPTPVLHRLILRTVGRPMWEYTSDLELLMGFRDALQAHKDLCDQGILHRDISAGNILLTTTSSSSLRGFITDLELARITHPTITKPEVTVTRTISQRNRYDDRGRVISRTQAKTPRHTKFESTVTVERGATMSGTAQFMAWEVLTGYGFVGHEEKHDVEAFIWVLSYCVMRNLCNGASQKSEQKEVQDQHTAFRSLFHAAFGQQAAKRIASQRQSRSICLLFPSCHSVQAIIARFMSEALVDLFKILRHLVNRASDEFDPTPLTHEAILTVVSDKIASLQVP